MNAFEERVRQDAEEGLRGLSLDTIQLNIGLRCNLACEHCHVVSSPKRTEEMDWETMALALQAARRSEAKLLDLTGGAPEMNPNFRRLIEAARQAGLQVMVRTNLTILLEPGYESMPEFYREQRVRLVASLPCYLEENVDRQRGEGVYQGSVEVIRRLNALGYGRDPELELTLVYNPIGPELPPGQEGLEEDYRRELGAKFGIEFTRLIAIANMPIGRFLGDLRRTDRDKEYLQTLREAYNAETVGRLMCQNQINVRWDGTIFDCDFNLALKLPVNHGAPAHIRDFDAEALARRKIATGPHCFGCTAGSGSSCGGALI